VLPYFLLVILPLLAWCISPKYRITLNRKTLSETTTLPIDFFMLIFLLIIGLRGLKCGTDTVQYENLFSQYGRMTLDQIFRSYDHELGFKLLCKAIHLITGNFQVFIAVTAFLCVMPLWYFYRHESEIQLLTIALFLGVAPFSMYVSGIRQAISMSIGIFAWYAARDRKLIRYLSIVFLALQFHNSAFMLFVLYPLYGAKITKRWIWFVIPGIIFVYAFRTEIFGYLLRFLWKEYESTPETGAMTILFLLIIFSVYCYIMPDEKRMDQDCIAMRNILLLSVTIQIFAMLHPLSMRMNYYFLIFLPILMPKIAKRSKSGLSQLSRLSVSVMTIYFIYFFLKNGINDNDALNIFPYIPFWQN